MKLRVGNACWHAFHIQHAFLCHEAGFFAQEGIDAEIVHAKINPKGIDASRPDGERYDEVGTVLRDMVAFGIDIIPDVHVRTPFAEKALGNDEVLIIGGWRNQFRGTLVGAPPSGVSVGTTVGGGFNARFTCATVSRSLSSSSAGVTLMPRRSASCWMMCRSIRAFSVWSGRERFC